MSYYFCYICESKIYEDEFPIESVDLNDVTQIVCFNCLNNRKHMFLQEVKDIIFRKERLYKYYDRFNYNIYKKALRRKQLIPKPCTVCGTTKDICGHHYNYKHPFKVIWLCNSCHIKLHFCIKRIESYYIENRAFNLWL